MNIRFQFDVTVTIAGMDELIEALRGDLSKDERRLLIDVLSISKGVSSRLVEVDESRPTE